MSTRLLQWAQCDVFAEAQYEGNPLAIFTDGTGLTTEQMQALARETNLSETTFILPATPEEEVRNGVRVRIFTVAEELPFAGHPTLGTASWIRLNLPHFANADEVKLRLNAGTIPVRFLHADGNTTRAEMRQRDPEFGTELDRAAVAKASGLEIPDLHPQLPPQVVSTGLPFCILPVATVDALQRVRPQQGLQDLLHAHGAKFVYAITPVDGGWRARMPFNGSDDPATGSAAGCAISYILHRGFVSSGETLVMKQGVEVHRPSRIELRATLQEGSERANKRTTITDVVVGGSTIFVATGAFLHP